eukprot:351455-Chlamydomonas_euryale.AAC.4
MHVYPALSTMLVHHATLSISCKQLARPGVALLPAAAAASPPKMPLRMDWLSSISSSSSCCWPASPSFAASTALEVLPLRTGRRHVPLVSGVHVGRSATQIRLGNA